MSNNLGTLTLDLVAKMGGWVEGFTQAERATKAETRKMQRSIKNVEKSVQSMTNSLKAAAGIIGVTLSARALDGWVRGSIQAASATGEFAKKIGSTAEELSTLRYIAVQAGSSIGALDGSMLRLNSRLGADLISGGPAATSLKELKLSSSELIKMPLEQKILAIGEAMKGLDRGVQLRHLQNMAGDSARDLVEMFNMSKDQFDDLTERAKKLGYVISSETANSATAVLAQIDDIKGAFNNLSLQILSDNLPAIEEFLSSITADDIEKSMKIARVIVENLGTAIKSLAVSYGTILAGRVAVSTVAIIKSTNAKIRDIAITKMQEGATRSAAIAAGRHAVAINALKVSLGAFGGPLGIASLAALSFAAFSLSTKKAAMSADDLDAKLLELEQTMGSMTANQIVFARRKFSDHLIEEKKALDEYEKDLEISKSKILNLKSQMEGGFTSEQKIVFGKALDKEIRKYEELAAKVDGTTQSINKSSNAVKDLTTQLSILSNTSTVSIDAISSKFKDIADKIEDETNRIGLKTRVATFDYELEHTQKYSGLSPDQIDKIRAKYQELDNAIAGNRSGGSKGINLVDTYTNKLVSLSDEMARLVSLNNQLATTGYESQYNAVSSIRHEIESQNSALSKLSSTQQQILIMKAQELDTQKEINAILSIGNEYNQKIDDMMFEVSLYGKMRSEIEKLTFYRDLDTQAKLMAIGMSDENIAKLDEEIARIKELYALYRAEKDDSENDAAGGIKQGFDDYIDSIGSVRDQFANATKSTLDSLSDGLAEFVATGKLDFGELTRSILLDLSKMLVKMALVNAMKSMLGGYAEGGLVGTGYSSGGFTGAGGKYDEAGIVHKNEYVFSKSAVQSLGVSNLERLHQAGKTGKSLALGYANGGLVGSNMKLPELSSSGYLADINNSSPEINITVYVSEDGESDAEAYDGLGKKIDDRIKITVKREIATAQRPGGALSR